MRKKPTMRIPLGVLGLLLALTLVFGMLAAVLWMVS